MTVSRVGPAMQVGIGANDKTGAFGASAWLGTSSPANHWDLNMTLREVSAPGTLGLMLVGVMGLVVVRRRISK